METSPDQLLLRIARLEQELERLRCCERLAREMDEALEVALRDRLPLDRAVQGVLPLLVEHTGARAAFLRTYDESLRLQDFGWPAGVVKERTFSFERVCSTVRRDRITELAPDGRCLLGLHLDVAGEPFGWAALHLDRLPPEPEQEQIWRLLLGWCEALDNYLAAIALSHHKDRVTDQLSDALKEPVLDVGIQRAIAVLSRSVAFEDLILVYRHEEDHEGDTFHYKVIKRGELVHDSSNVRDPEVDCFMRQRSFQVISGDSRSVTDRFGMTRFREEVLINGVKTERIVGRVMISSSRGEFNTFDRELLRRFADYLRQRIVDFNREWKYLSLCFAKDVVNRLLSTPDYRERYLRPQEREVAILFADISGFTRISEQVLKKPVLIGRLIDRWSAQAVEIIWKTGGVFDKMVGDCVIGLWGPPFFEISAREACQRAAEAALQIRAFTRSLPAGGELPELAGIDPPLGVGTVLNHCPVLVGHFGPSEDFTCFSSGMNNTARLQGLAARNEILCMDTFVAAHGDPACFGERRQAEVKNVEKPLVFHPLRG